MDDQSEEAPRTQCCRNCDAYQDNGPTALGECHADTPTGWMFVVPGPPPQGRLAVPQGGETPGMTLNIKVNGFWPPVHELNWCLKWTPKGSRPLDS